MTDFGTDLSGIFDLDPGMAEVNGRLLLGQALARRIVTPRGRLIDDPNYGTDITQYLNDDLGPADLVRIAVSMDAEFLKDERVVSSHTTLTFQQGVLSTTTVIDDGAGPFKLVLTVDQVSVTSLQVQ